MAAITGIVAAVGTGVDDQIIITDELMRGEIGSRLLELAGVVCNKNMLPGDVDGAHASGLRFGLTWLTQRGVTEAQLREIAGVVRSVLGSVRTCTIWSRYLR